MKFRNSKTEIVENGRCYKNLTYIDLRCINSASAALELKLIENVKFVFYSSGIEGDIRHVVSKIPCKNVAYVRFIPNDYEIVLMKGTVVLSKEDLVNRHKYFVIEGDCIITGSEKGLPNVKIKPIILVDGNLLIDNEMREIVDIDVVSGETKIYDDFYKYFAFKELIFDRMIYNKINDGAVISLEKTIKFDKAITCEMLGLKNIRFFIKRENDKFKLKANKRIRNYVLSEI